MSDLPEPTILAGEQYRHFLSDQNLYSESQMKVLLERIQQLTDALHEIYGRACVAMGEDDDLVLYQFAQEARDIALRAAKENGNG